VRELASIVDGGQLIIFGDTQSGKTTLATRLAEELSLDPPRK
jgi:adenylate kinase family enzyme